MFLNWLQERQRQEDEKLYGDLYETELPTQKEEVAFLEWVKGKHVFIEQGFLAITFYYLFFRTEVNMICVNIFYVVRNEISAGSDKK